MIMVVLDNYIRAFRLFKEIIHELLARGLFLVQANKSWFNNYLSGKTVLADY